MKTLIENCSNGKVNITGAGLEVAITSCSNFDETKTAVTAGFTTILDGISPLSIPNPLSWIATK